MGKKSNEMTTRITLPLHLKEYLVAKFGNYGEEPVHFPDECDLYHVLYDLLQKRPADCPVDSGNVEIFLPNRSYGKKPETYNYLSERSQKILTKRIELAMWAEVHELLDYQKHQLGNDFIEGVHTFMTRYSIESLSEDAFLKNYYRWRQSLRRREKKRDYKRKKCID